MAPREGVVEGHRTAAVLVVLRLARARLAAACLARRRPDLFLVCETKDRVAATYLQ